MRGGGLSHHACGPLGLLDVSEHLLEYQIALHLRHFKLLPRHLRLPPLLIDLLPEKFSLLLEHLQHVLLLLLLVLLDPLDLRGCERCDVLIQELAEFNHDLSACGVHLQDVILAGLDQ